MGLLRSVLLLLLLLGLSACGGGDQGRIVLELQLRGLTELGSGAHYQGWAVVDGQPKSTGKFVIDASETPAAVRSLSGFRYGDVDKAVFGPSNTSLGTSFPFIQDASRFFVTVELANDPSSAPSGNVVLSGSFTGDDEAILGVADAIGDLSSASGSAILDTPTSSTAPATRGIWFLDHAPPGEGPGLVLPALSGSWTWEAWVDDGSGNLVSLGRFDDPAQPDEDASNNRVRGDESLGYPVPGQDFVAMPVVGETPILDFSTGGWTVSVTVEPQPDNSLAPFPLSLLSVAVPVDAVNASGQGQDAFDLAPVTGLPQLDATAAPGSLTLAGTLPGVLNAPRDGHYAVWAVISGTPAHCGSFTPDNAGQVFAVPSGANLGSAAAFVLDPTSSGLGASFPAVENATEIFVSFELQGGPFGGAPSEQILLAGLLSSGQGSLTLEGLAPAGGRGLADFSAIAGSAVLRTPTNVATSSTTDDQHGLWFQSTGGTSTELILPFLPSGWRYEAWVDDGAGQRWSLGRFSDPDGPDEDAILWEGRGSGLGFSLPGQDFVTANLGAVLDPGLLANRPVYLSVEPKADFDRGPFLLVLEGTAAGAALQSFGLTPTPALADAWPTGRVSFNR